MENCSTYGDWISESRSPEPPKSSCSIQMPLAFVHVVSQCFRLLLTFLPKHMSGWTLHSTSVRTRSTALDAPYCPQTTMVCYKILEDVDCFLYRRIHILVRVDIDDEFHLPGASIAFWWLILLIKTQHSTVLEVSSQLWSQPFCMVLRSGPSIAAYHFKSVPEKCAV